MIIKHWIYIPYTVWCSTYISKQFKGFSLLVYKNALNNPLYLSVWWFEGPTVFVSWQWGGGGGLAAGMGMRSFALGSFAQNCSFKEPFTHVALYKRVMRAHQSLKRATWVIRSWFAHSLSKHKRFCLEKIIVFTMFLIVFHCFSPRYAQERIALLSVALF